MFAGHVRNTHVEEPRELGSNCTIADAGKCTIEYPHAHKNKANPAHTITRKHAPGYRQQLLKKGSTI
jgi:hypothetical protein